MLLVQPLERRPGASSTCPKPPSAPGSELSALLPASRIARPSRRADDRRGNRQRAVVERGRPRRDRVPVVERVGAGPVLRDHRPQLAGRPHRRRPARRDDSPAAGARGRSLLEELARRRRRREGAGGPAKRRPSVPAITAARAPASSGDRDPGPAEAGVAVDQDAELVPCVRRRTGQAGEQRSVVGGDEILTRRRSCASCSSFRPPTRLYGTSTSSIPASAITSASCSVWQVMPAAPSSICRRAISTHLCVFTCGRLARPTRSQCSCQRARLASSRSRSTTAAGVAMSRLKVTRARAGRRWQRRRGAPRRRAGTARRVPPAPALAATRSARRA